VWDRTAFVFAWAIAMVFALYALDSVVNAMVNPVYLLIAGGLCGLAPALRRVPVVAHAAQAPRPLART
jgi:hypothetical protein